MTDWPQVSEDIKDQLEMYTVQGEYLEGFHIYLTDDADTVQNPKLPYMVIVFHGATPYPGFLDARYASTLQYEFRFAVRADGKIYGVNYTKDKLVQYIVKKHWEWLMSYEPTDPTEISVYEIDIPSQMETGYANDPTTNDIVNAGMIQWTMTVLNEVL